MHPERPKIAHGPLRLKVKQIKHVDSKSSFRCILTDICDYKAKASELAGTEGGRLLCLAAARG